MRGGPLLKNYLLKKHIGVYHFDTPILRDSIRSSCNKNVEEYDRTARDALLKILKIT